MTNGWSPGINPMIHELVIRPSGRAWRTVLLGQVVLGELTPHAGWLAAHPGCASVAAALGRARRRGGDDRVE
jgi:hypothetical protein